MRHVHDALSLHGLQLHSKYVSLNFTGPRTLGRTPQQCMMYREISRKSDRELLELQKTIPDFTREDGEYTHRHARSISHVGIRGSIVELQKTIPDLTRGDG
jgi:hypothetical protein